MKMRRLAALSGLAVLSAVAFSTKAQAQTTNVDFEGVIGPACIINSVTNGTLFQASSQFLVADDFIGIPGNINVTCTNGTTFTITSISDNGSALTNGTFNTGISLIQARISYAGLSVARGEVSPDGNSNINFPINNAGPLQTGPISNQDYSVELILSRNLPDLNLSSGFYKVRVGVALTPQ